MVSFSVSISAVVRIWMKKTNSWTIWTNDKFVL